MPFISYNDSRRPLRRFESVGSVIAMAYQGDFASDFWACWQALRAKLEHEREDHSSKQSVPHTPNGMNAKNFDAKERRGSPGRLAGSAAQNACVVRRKLVCKSLQSIVNQPEI